MSPRRPNKKVQQLLKNKEAVKKLYRTPEKQYVREEAWLKRARDRLEKINQNIRRKHKGLIYFTLCSLDAIDIRTLYREGILQRKNNRFDTVFFCEKIHEWVNDISRYVGPQYYDGKFEEFIEELNNNESTRNSLKEMNLFPFDVCNLDFSGSCIPDYDQEPYSQTLRAIETLIKLQHQEQQSFELFLTFRALQSRDNKSAITELRKLLKENLTNQEVKNVFVRSYESLDNLASSYHKFLLVTISKLISSIVYEETTNYELIIHPHHIYKNANENYYLVNITLSLDYISRMRRRKGIRRIQGIQNEDYRKSIMSILKNKIIDVDKILSDSKNKRKYDDLLNSSLNLN